MVHVFALYCHFQQAEDLESGFASDVESKYKKIYEDDINPFAAFSKKVVNLLFLSFFDEFVNFHNIPMRMI